MPKFYQYIIYKLYSWGLRRDGDTPIANVILTLTIIHFIQIFFIYMLILRIFPEINIFIHVNKIYIGVFMVFFAVMHYFIIYNKKRWESYLIKFGKENIEESRRGNKLVLAYLIGTILLFFIVLPLVY